MKKIILIALLIISLFICVGCSNSNHSAPVVTNASIILPDGQVITGPCTKFIRYSQNWCGITINGVNYYTDSWRVVRWYE